MELAREAAVIGGMVTTGLMAGLYLAFSIAVMPGLARGSDTAYVEAMRGINAAILNGWFLVVFLGPLPLDVVAVAARLPHRDGLWWCVTALVLYAATLVVTGAVNVPLNNRLDSTEPAGAARELFERRWTTWNRVRTILCTASFATLLPAVVAL